MKKVLNIAWKDLRLTLRDPAALVMMLVTPFALTLAIAFAFGGLTGGGAGGTGLQDIPVVIVNHDPGQFGEMLVQVFQSPDLAQLLAPTIVAGDAAARAAVDADQAAAAVIIPDNFSESILPSGLMEGDFSGAMNRPQSVVDVYSNPTAPISAGVVRSIVDRFLNQVTAGLAGGQVSITQLISSGLLSPQQAMGQGQEIAQRAGQAAADSHLVAVELTTAGAEGSNGFDWMAYMAPSMAILFLMFTVSAGGRSILAERDDGTLPRMLVSPTSAAQVLGGKVFAIYLTGVGQIAILIAASGLLFGVRWGNPLAVALLTLVLVAAATGWGMLIAALARTPGQANAVGSAIALIFGAAAGNFIPRQTLPQALQTASYVSPNAWGLEAFSTLSAGGTLADITVPLIALLVMAVVLFSVAVVGFRRQYG